jgi:hypothetical protein
MIHLKAKYFTHGHKKSANKENGRNENKLQLMLKFVDVGKFE